MAVPTVCQSSAHGIVHPGHLTPGRMHPEANTPQRRLPQKATRI
jgi:hypothetical protein